MFKEIYPTPTSERKRILDFNEFKETLVDQGEGYERLTVYLQSLFIFNLFATLGNRSFLVLFSIIWFLFLFQSQIRKYRLTFTEERLIVRGIKISKSVDYVWGIIGSILFISYFFNILPPYPFLQNLFIPRILPALILFVLSIVFPQAIPEIGSISVLIPSIIFLSMFFYSIKSEDQVLQSSYKMTKSVIISKRGGLSRKGILLFFLLGFLQIGLNMAALITQIFAVDLISFILFPFNILFMIRYRNNDRFGIQIFNPYGKPINSEILIDEINLQRFAKAISSVFSFSPHPFGKFPYQIVDTEDLSKFPTGSSAISKSFVPFANAIGAGIGLIATILASFVLIFRNPNSLGAILLGSPLIWITYIVLFKAFSRLSHHLIKSEPDEEIFFSSEIIGYVSATRLWVSSILSLEALTITNQNQRPLKLKNSIHGDYTNWKLILFYTFFLLIYGIFAQWIRFGALNAEGIYRLGIYYYNQTVEILLGIILTQPLIILTLSTLIWAGILWFLPQFLSLTRPNLIMEFGKNAFLSHRSEEINSALFVGEMVNSFKFYTSKRISTHVRPSYIVLRMRIEYSGEDTIRVKIAERDIALGGSNPRYEDAEIRLEKITNQPTLPLIVRLPEREEVYKLNIDLKQPPNGVEFKLQNGFLNVFLQGIVLMD